MIESPYGAASTANPWLLQGAPGPAEFVIFGFHYAGTGAGSSYRDWPQQIGSGWFCPLQPPGREDRIVEDPLPTQHAFAEQLAAAIRPYLDRPYAFVGHCGAFPYMLETTLHLAELGLPLPRRLFASSWGAPHKGLYGRLNFVDLDQLDIIAEIQQITQLRLGSPLPTDLVELAAETLMFDLRALRGYRYDGNPPVPCPTVVLGWTEDDIVPPEEVWPSAWDECSNASYHLLQGDHWEFLRCSPKLRAIIETEMMN
ncbi:MAG TPA: thioesterase domain-containing protein [Pseudonocardiaceae bacterium]|nr:thioesterase domain-containing protein [Pseudonocardiaceae bacterium]